MAFYRELHRPQFHFSPRENWTNDPHGLVYQDGVWHLFFQHNPEAPVWGNMTWGYAVSDDLIHWQQLGHALYPDEHGDMFTGSAVVDHANTAGFGKGALLAFYAAQTWSDAPDGRRIQISWMAGGLYPEMPFNQQMSIPVELTLAGSGDNVTLMRWPVGELDSLRRRTINLDRQAITPGSPLVANAEAKLLDVSFTVSKQDANALYVVIRGQPMVFDWSSRGLGFRSSGSHKLAPDQSQVPLPDGSSLSVRLLIDKTSVEVFINRGRISASFCFLPSGYIQPLVLESHGGEQIVDNFELHEFASIWN